MHVCYSNMKIKYQIEFNTFSFTTVNQARLFTYQQIELYKTHPISPVSFSSTPSTQPSQYHETGESYGKSISTHSQTKLYTFSIITDIKKKSSNNNNNSDDKNSCSLMKRIRCV